MGISTSVLQEDALCEIGKGPFKYYVIKEVGRVGLKSEKHDDLILEWSLRGHSITLWTR